MGGGGDQSKWIIPKSEAQTAPLTSAELQKLLVILGHKGDTRTDKVQTSPRPLESSVWMFASLAVLMLLVVCMWLCYKLIKFYQLHRAKRLEYRAKKLEMMRIIRMLSNPGTRIRSLNAGTRTTMSNE